MAIFKLLLQTRDDHRSVHNLEWILKRLLRDHQYRCIDVIEVSAQPESVPALPGNREETES